MSRSKRFFTGLLSSYATIGINILYTLASIPLALHYLDKEEFGLWALVTQLSGYLMLLEFGMTGSVARSLSDHKDQMDQGVYGSILRTGGRVFAIQGFMVATAGCALAWFAPSLLNLPSRLHQPFTLLMAAQAMITGIKLSMGSLGAPLWCHQRLDINNLISGMVLIISFAVLWIGFHIGFHVYSIAASNLIGQILSATAIYYACSRLGYYPSKENRGLYSPKLFRELFHFGGGLFLMNIGAQLATASQVIVISRLLGIETAAVWSIATKVFTMAQQFVSKILDSSAGGLAEMVVRKESTQLLKRYREILSLTAVMAVACSAGIALLNGSFINVWTSGKVTWDPLNNYLLACVFFFVAISRCLTGLTGITKRLNEMKYVYFVEGVLFVSLSIALIPILGIAGLLAASLGSNIFVTCVSALRYASNHFKIPVSDFITCFKNSTYLLLLTAILFWITQSNLIQIHSSVVKIVIELAIFLFILIPLIYFYGMERNIRLQIHDTFYYALLKFKKNQQD